MLEKQRIRIFWQYILPGFAVYAVFFIYPFINAFYISFTNWDGFAERKSFIGLQNYAELFRDRRAISAFGHNIQMFLYTAVFTFILAMLFAVLITQFRLRGKSFYRVVFYFPNVLNVVVVGLIWMLILSPTDVGMLNAFLGAVGLGGWKHAWLGELGTVLPALSVPWIWMAVGFYMLLFIAAIQSVPDDILEAAIIDGASKWKQFIALILPLIWETVRTAIIFFLLHAFNSTFIIVNLLTRGGPGKASELLTTYMYENAFSNRRFAYATTIGMTIFLILVILSLLSLKVTKREVHEY